MLGIDQEIAGFDRTGHRCMAGVEGGALAKSFRRFERQMHGTLQVGVHQWWYVWVQVTESPASETLQVAARSDCQNQLSEQTVIC